MNIDSMSVYVGPNVYAKEPLIRLTIDVKPAYAERLEQLGGRVMDQLVGLLPGWAAAKGADAEWLASARDGRFDLGNLVARLALELQRAAGQRGDLAWSERNGDASRMQVFYSFDSEPIGLEAGEVACDLLVTIAKAEDDPRSTLQEDLDSFLRYADRRTLGPSAMELVRAAEARDIPWYRLNDASLIQVGQGKYQQRIEAALTSQTSHIAVEIASDKNMCNQLLGGLGLPVPKQRVVYDADEALSAADRIGYPVVIKPLDGNHGRGVTVNITDDETVIAAFDHADKEGSAVVVESMILGDDHRLLVVNGELVAAARRVPGHVKGDGQHSIASLVDIVNQDPRRGVGHENVLTP